MHPSYRALTLIACAFIPHHVRKISGACMCVNGNNKCRTALYQGSQTTISLSTYSHGVHIGTYSQRHAQLNQPLGKHEGVFDRSLNPERWCRA